MSQFEKISLTYKLVAHKANLFSDPSFDASLNLNNSADVIRADGCSPVPFGLFFTKESTVDV
jgi:hypothetical protein